MPQSARDKPSTPSTFIYVHEERDLVTRKQLEGFIFRIPFAETNLSHILSISHDDYVANVE